MLGVCMDSVAAVEAAMTGGQSSLYPLVLGGDAKMLLLQTYEDIWVRAGRGLWCLLL